MHSPDYSRITLLYFRTGLICEEPCGRPCVAVNVSANECLEMEGYVGRSFRENTTVGFTQGILDTAVMHNILSLPFTVSVHLDVASVRASFPDKDHKCTNQDLPTVCAVAFSCVPLHRFAQKRTKEESRRGNSRFRYLRSSLGISLFMFNLGAVSRHNLFTSAVSVCSVTAGRE